MRQPAYSPRYHERRELREQIAKSSDWRGESATSTDRRGAFRFPLRYSRFARNLMQINWLWRATLTDSLGLAAASSPFSLWKFPGALASLPFPGAQRGGVDQLRTKQVGGNSGGHFVRRSGRIF